LETASRIARRRGEKRGESSEHIMVGKMKQRKDWASTGTLRMGWENGGRHVETDFPGTKKLRKRERSLV